MNKKPNKVYLSDLMSDDDKAKMKAFKLANEKTQSEMITHEWLAVCEFGFYYGWEAIKSFENDEITINDMYRYIDGARNIHARHVYDAAKSARAGNTSTDGFNTLMSPYLKEMKEVN